MLDQLPGDASSQAAAICGDVFEDFSTITVESDGGLTFEDNVVDASGGVALDFEPEGLLVITANTITSDSGSGMLLNAPQGATIASNTIYAGAGDGIYVASGSGVLITNNAITAIGGLPINLAPGVNNGQSAPTIASAALDASGNLTISYSIPPTLGATYPLTIDFYGQPAAGGPPIYLGSDTYNLNSDGSSPVNTITLSVNGELQSGDTLFATATDAAGNTSVLSAGFIVM